MTAATAICGLLPILLLRMHGTGIERPLAIVMTGRFGDFDNFYPSGVANDLSVVCKQVEENGRHRTPATHEGKRFKIASRVTVRRPCLPKNREAVRACSRELYSALIRQQRDFFVASVLSFDELLHGP